MGYFSEDCHPGVPSACVLGNLSWLSEDSGCVFQQYMAIHEVTDIYFVYLSTSQWTRDEPKAWQRQCLCCAGHVTAVKYQQHTTCLFPLWFLPIYTTASDNSTTNLFTRLLCFFLTTNCSDLSPEIDTDSENIDALTGGVFSHGRGHLEIYHTSCDVISFTFEKRMMKIDVHFSPKSGKLAQVTLNLVCKNVVHRSVHNQEHAEETNLNFCHVL